MILALAVVLGILVSLARHGRRTVEQISGIPLRSVWLVLIALALQWPLLRAPFGNRQQVIWQQLLFLSSHLLLLAFVWRNRQITGIRIVGVGVICNFLVVVANGGFMPISPETLTQINPDSTLAHWPSGYHYGYSKDLILLREETRLWALSDVLALPPPFPWPAALSLGDLLIALGIVVLLQGPVCVQKEEAAVSEQAVADYQRGGIHQ